MLLAVITALPDLNVDTHPHLSKVHEAFGLVLFGMYALGLGLAFAAILLFFYVGIEEELKKERRNAPHC